jgi:hypothetical protein
LSGEEPVVNSNVAPPRWFAGAGLALPVLLAAGLLVTGLLAAGLLAAGVLAAGVLAAVAVAP